MWQRAVIVVSVAVFVIVVRGVGAVDTRALRAPTANELRIPTSSSRGSPARIDVGGAPDAPREEASIVSHMPNTYLFLANKQNN